MRLLGRRISKKKAATNEFGGGVSHAIKKPKQKKSANMKAVNISELPVLVTVDLSHAVSVFNQTTRPSSSSNNNQAKNLSAAQTPRKAMSPLKADYLSSSGKVRRHKLKTDSKLFTPEKSFLTPTPEMSPAKTVNNNIPSPVKVSSMIVFEKEFVEKNEDNPNEADNILDSQPDNPREPEEVTLDEDSDGDEEIIVEKERNKQYEMELKNIEQYENFLSRTDVILNLVMNEEAKLKIIQDNSWFAKPRNWKPASTWESWNASVKQICAHYKVRDIPVDTKYTFPNYR